LLLSPFADKKVEVLSREGNYKLEQPEDGRPKLLATEQF
jgi:hypothetical protein